MEAGQVEQDSGDPTPAPALREWLLLRCLAPGTSGETRIPQEGSAQPLRVEGFTPCRILRKRWELGGGTWWAFGENRLHL